MLLSALAVGLLVGMFQAATQINEMTMTFIPKMLVVAVALLMFFPWMLQLMIDFVNIIITDSQQRQYLVQTVEYNRERFDSFKKQTLNKWL